MKLLQRQISVTCIVFRLTCMYIIELGKRFEKEREHKVLGMFSYSTKKRYHVLGILKAFFRPTLVRV